MSVVIRLTGQLKTLFNDQSNIIVEAGYTVRATLTAMQIQPEIIAGVVVNGDLQSKDYILREEDEVKLFAVMGGG
jgi:sulfur carrier protein ThiS